MVFVSRVCLIFQIFFLLFILTLDHLGIYSTNCLSTNSHAETKTDKTIETFSWPHISTLLNIYGLFFYTSVYRSCLLCLYTFCTIFWITIQQFVLTKIRPFLIRRQVRRQHRWHSRNERFVMLVSAPSCLPSLPSLLFRFFILLPIWKSFPKKITFTLTRCLQKFSPHIPSVNLAPASYYIMKILKKCQPLLEIFNLDKKSIFFM